MTGHTGTWWWLRATVPPVTPAPAGASRGSCPVTVVVPAYNRAGLIARSLTSVAAQTLPPAEVIVVDDNSTDGTPAVAERLGARVIRRTSNGGPSAARNAGIAAATQPWIAVLDSDDEWLPNHLETLWPLTDGHDLVAAAAIVQRADGTRRVGGWVGWRPALLTSPAQLLYPENPIPATALMRREAAVRAGGYDERMRYAEDLDLYVRILERGTGAVVPEPTLVYRLHGDQLTAQISKMQDERVRLARHYATRDWSDAPLIERLRAVTAWDDLRRALDEGRRSEARRLGRWLLARPARVLAIVGLWAWRYRGRRAMRRLR